MTSNLGAHYLLDEALEDVGYSEEKTHSKVMVAENQLSAVIIFNSLGAARPEKIVQKATASIEKMARGSRCQGCLEK
jgi:ATP-dependent Clp protease ATP-binding subunit ClpA